MNTSQTYFIGVDPSAGQRRIAYAALDEDLRPMALGRGSFEEVLAYVGGQKQAVVAIAASPRPNFRLMVDKDRRAALESPPTKGKWKDCRLAEYLLFTHGVQSFVTPSKASACKAWMRMGFEFYAKLGSLDYEPYPNDEAGKVLMEAWPLASYSAWLEGKLLPKYSLEGRLQRQIALYDLGLHLRDGMQFFEEITRHRLLLGQLPEDVPYEADELDALALAYTAYLSATRPEAVELLGDAEEGQVAVPRPKMSDN